MLRYRGLPLKALFRNPALGLDRPTSPSLNRSVHLSLVGTSLVLVPTSTITYLHTLRTDGSKRTLTKDKRANELNRQRRCRQLQSVRTRDWLDAVTDRA